MCTTELIYFNYYDVPIFNSHRTYASLTRTVCSCIAYFVYTSTRINTSITFYLTHIRERFCLVLPLTIYINNVRYIAKEDEHAKELLIP